MVMKRSPIENAALLKGFGGWLSLFYLSLIIINPLTILFRLSQRHTEWSKLYDSIPGLEIHFYLLLVIDLLFLALCVKAGYDLHKMNTSSIKKAKLFLGLTGIYLLVVSFLPLVFGYPDSIEKSFTSIIPTNIVGGVFYIAIWFSYLSNSKRVKATFPNN